MVYKAENRRTTYRSGDGTSKNVPKVPIDTFPRFLDTYDAMMSRLCDGGSVRT